MPSNKEEDSRSQKMHDDRLSDRNRASSFSKRNAATKYTARVEEKKKENQKPLMLEFFNVLPRAWKGVVIGVIVGLIPLIAIVFLRPEWNLVGLLGLVVLALIGFVIGKMMQTKKLVRGR